jgi:xeroderma pigmentosum group C-complementing protein
MSLTPLSLQNGFAMITKARVPEAGKRGRLFETALQRLVEWWDEFFEVIPEGHLRSRTFDEVSAELKAKEERRILHDEAKRRNKKGKQKAEETDHDEEDADGEVLHSAKSLMKHALMQEGSRDVSALLFTALCRALGIPSRLVVSLQSVPWQTGIGKPKTSTTKKPKASNGLGPTVPEGETRSRAPTPDLKGSKSAFPVGGHRLDGGTTSSPIKTPPPRVIKLRKSKPAGQTLGSSSSRSLKPPDPLTTPPVFWTEVFSRPDGRWMPVDPLRGIVNKRKEFDPAAKPQTGPGRRFKQENRMVYVVAIEQDGYGRDVTPRYAKDYGAKVAKLQGAERGGAAKGRREWWERVCNMILRPYRLVGLFDDVVTLFSFELDTNSTATTSRTRSYRRTN